LLPLNIQIWAGGAGISIIRKKPQGVKLFFDLNEAILALNDIPIQ
jgi:hypothetical protein